MTTPAPLILSVGFIFSYTLSSGRDEKAAYFIIISLLVLLAMNLFTKNLRYVMILDMPVRLFSVLMLGAIFSKHLPRHRDAAVLCSVIFLAAYDLISFSGLFIAGGIYDPVSFTLLSVRRFIPF